MGSCLSVRRSKRRDEELMLDDYYDPANLYHGDQSWLYYRVQEGEGFYNTEFQPQPSKSKKSRFSIRSKIQSLRKSFFNPDTHEEEIYRSPYELKRDSKGGFIERIENWRRSWFGAEPSPKPNRKLSLNKEQEQKRSSMSESGFKRLSVTRNFVQRHGDPEEVYRKSSKSPNTSRKTSLESPQRCENIEVQAMMGTNHSSKKNEIVMEDEISQSAVRRPSIDREILQKIKEIASFDYGSSGSEEDISKVNDEITKEKGEEEDKMKNVAIECRGDGDGTEDETKNCERKQEDLIEDAESQERFQEKEIRHQFSHEVDEIQEEDMEEIRKEDLVDEISDDIEDPNEEPADTQLREGIELFKDDEEEEEVRQQQGFSEEGCDEEGYDEVEGDNKNDDEGKEVKSDVDVDEDEECKPKKSVFVNSDGKSQATSGSRIVINSRSTRN